MNKAFPIPARGDMDKRAIRHKSGIEGCKGILVAGCLLRKLCLQQMGLLSQRLREVHHPSAVGKILHTGKTLTIMPIDKDKLCAFRVAECKICDIGGNEAAAASIKEPEGNFGDG